MYDLRVLLFATMLRHAPSFELKNDQIIQLAGGAGGIEHGFGTPDSRKRAYCQSAFIIITVLVWDKV